MINKMERDLQKYLSRILKKEKFQAKMISYMSKVGKLLLFILPIALVIITILTLFYPRSFTLLIIFYAILAIYLFNSIMLFLGANSTESSLKLRLNFERKRGRPIDSLDGFDLLANNVKRVTNLLKIISLICLVALVLFLIMLFLEDLNLGFAAAGLSLVGFGLALLIRSLNLNIHDVNGLQDFYKPTTHQIFLDNFFAEILSNHLDPVTFLKWDEYLAELNKILTPEFIQKVKQQEAEELPITFALEKLLFLYYLKFQEVLSEDQLIWELKEIINIVLDSVKLPSYVLDKVEAEVYGETIDILIDQNEIASAAIGPHPLDENWGIFDAWAGVGFGIERIAMVKKGAKRIKQVSRSLTSLDGICLDIQ